MSDRPELAVREGYPPPRDLPRGFVTVTRLADCEVRIDRADPHVLFSAELLSMIDRGEGDPCVSLERQSCDCPEGGVYHCLGALLKIRAGNRNVVYRITEYVAAVDGYIGDRAE